LRFATHVYQTLLSNKRSNFAEFFSKLLGEDFLRRVEASVQTIQRHHQIYPIAVEEFRRALVRRFPFEISYDASENLLVVYSVFNCSQDPQKWRERLPGAH
jgi:hypothetical protein